MLAREFDPMDHRLFSPHPQGQHRLAAQAMRERRRVIHMYVALAQQRLARRAYSGAQHALRRMIERTGLSAQEAQAVWRTLPLSPEIRADYSDYLQQQSLLPRRPTAFTAAMTVLGTDWHVTLCFGRCAKAGKVSTTQAQGELFVTDVCYWSHVNLTVALVASPLCDERHAYWRSHGYSSDLPYRPHMTLGAGDLTAQYQHLKGARYPVGQEYCRTY